ncbi:spermidine hydroxycinnamoyl transferase [Senna tora]|uniref:Spermidine hydroxycinnamoyl transferase n=1 Tax=Senna tora TaxID=362788 RepID=A0A834X4S8_9FABA|nr:spermidine hydroxycinnamoyl transferase [Senna tora]
MASSTSSVRLKGKLSVKPCDPTWKGSMGLSELDQIGILTHVTSIYLYHPNNSHTHFAHTLKTSLSKALVPFYPLAGRLHWIGNNNGRLELQCNAMGAQFIEAECESRLDDLIAHDLASSPPYDQLFPQIDYTLPLHHLPLLLVQLTSFKCGSLTISLAISHAVVDGPGSQHFISEWARLARGEPLQIMPFHDRTVLQSRDPPPTSLPPCLDHSERNPPPLLLGHSDSTQERTKKTTMATLKITKAQVEALRKTANESWACDPKPMGRRYTRYESITAHIWRSTCKARGHKKEQPTGLGVSVDLRSRMRPPLPKEYFGNAILDVVATSLAGDLVSKPLGYGASKIREVIEKVTDEYVRLGIELLKKEEDLTMFQDIHAISSDEKGPFYGNPNLAVTSWLTLPIHGFDFGWGEEFHMGLGPHGLDGSISIFHSRDGDASVEVVLYLQELHMDAFKKHFYEDMMM